ncbi:hypothetical protein RclHR1_33890001 [Rhizophagus clarus]|uniref:Protein kinase domain-containing protein n=1 Tax=Rhizophagus clarus TaxID=94130 RepID=A0A2Z6RLC6_9GLOM|nr:hypothetical protein RclHR1_33890001 [Rhizophagus clarus]
MQNELAFAACEHTRTLWSSVLLAFFKAKQYRILFLIYYLELKSGQRDNKDDTIKWIPYNKLYDIKYIEESDFSKIYKARWIDGYIYKWDDNNQNWKRHKQNMIVTLKYLNNPTNIILKFIKTAVSCKVCGITQDSKTKNYLVVLDIDNCKRCKIKCNTVYFQHNFDDWTSGNNDIDKFIQNTQLSAHNNVKGLIEWIPYNKLYDIKYIEVSDFNKVYKARWIDGYIYKWDDNNQNWERHEQNMIVILKYLNNPTSSTLEFINKIALSCKVYGITQDSKTKNYMVVLNINKCEKCKIECNAMYFQHNFNIWTSGNNDIDKLIQSTQLSDHTTHDIFDALVWIPYNKLYNKNILESNFNKMYSVKWYDRCIYKWDDNDQNWKRKGQNVFVALKSLNNPASITLITAPYKIYGITQDLETRNYMVVFDFRKCRMCKTECSTIYFKNNFDNWTSGNNDIDKFIQSTQLTVHYNAKDAIEWIPYNKFYDIKYIAKGGFGKITLHYKVNHYKCDIKLYGITQDPETENYIMVLDYAGNGNLRNYLDTSYNELSWTNRLNYLHSIAYGLKNIHDKELIHRDLHIGNILRLKNVTCITDMGLCKPADYDASENTKNKTYGVLPYIAPEILQGQNYAKTADIYSFGIIMYELISGLPPYHDVSHDINLAIKICQGLRPSQLFRESHDPDKYDVSNDSGIRKQIEEAERINNKLQIGSAFLTGLGISYETHSEAIYTSRLLNFDNLPQPKNSDDYYEVNDNIVSMKFSGINYNNCKKLFFQID